MTVFLLNSDKHLETKAKDVKNDLLIQLLAEYVDFDTILNV
jgi:hypothetical protein